MQSETTSAGPAILATPTTAEPTTQLYRVLCKTLSEPMSPEEARSAALLASQARENRPVYITNADHTSDERNRPMWTIIEFAASEPLKSSNKYKKKGLTIHTQRNRCAARQSDYDGSFVISTTYDLRPKRSTADS